MFSPLGLFHSTPCPQRQSCARPNCLFSHSQHVEEKQINIAYDDQPVAGPSNSAEPRQVVPAKRPALNPSSSPSTARTTPASAEPPRKIVKTGTTTARPLALPAPSTTGAPVLRVNAAQSKVPVSTRQALLKSLYDHFVVLYDAIIPQQPSIASEHALRQEEEVYARTTKATYRNAVISSIASLKSRPPPTSISHPSVGTSGDLALRASAAKALTSLTLTPAHLEPLLLTREELVRWGYIVDVPEEWGPGGDRPSAVDTRVKCERCSVVYVVKPVGEGGVTGEECTFHWGRPYTTKINGEKHRRYNCCSRLTSESEGCSRGPHVFYEAEHADLHARHAFTTTRPASEDDKDTALDLVALDCEMVYTTGGFRVARVSVVDGEGRKVFDQLVKMDDGVDVIDFNTRFSGIDPAEYASNAVLTLDAVRLSLDAYINAHTILIGHALDNDLKTLRMMHHRCVDTAILFLHRNGWPFRRALRDLTREHLDRTIQSGGGSSGHSSIEDSIATLDLVKFFVLNKKTKPYSLAGVPPELRAGASGAGEKLAASGSGSQVPSGAGSQVSSGTGSGGKSMGAVAPVRGVGTATGTGTGRAAGDGDPKKRQPLFDDTWG